MTLISILDMVGIFVFAISGALTARDKDFDLFGAFVIALVTSLGGGTLRDLLIGARPVGWLLRPEYLGIIVGAVAAAYLFQRFIVRLRRTMFLFDTIGIGLFTILGLQKALDAGLTPLVAATMGVVSAVFGGVTRDILCNEVPLIFRKEIYATACLAGAGLFLLLQYLAVDFYLRMVIAMALIIVIRMLAVRYKWRLAVK